MQQQQRTVLPRCPAASVSNAQLDRTALSIDLYPVESIVRAPAHPMDRYAVISPGILSRGTRHNDSLQPMADILCYIPYLCLWNHDNCRLHHFARPGNSVEI
jgi:hypothetical protein